MQHRYVEMTSYLTSSKMPFTDKDGHSIKALQKEKSMTLEVIVKRICEQELKSSFIKSLSEKLINSAVFDTGRLPGPDCSVASRRCGISACVKARRPCGRRYTFHDTKH